MWRTCQDCGNKMKVSGHGLLAQNAERNGSSQVVTHTAMAITTDLSLLELPQEILYNIDLFIIQFIQVIDQFVDLFL